MNLIKSSFYLLVCVALISCSKRETSQETLPEQPNILFISIADLRPEFGSYGNEYVKFSPQHNVKKLTPPTQLFLGTEDDLIPVETAKYYQMVMNRVGSLCKVKLYKGQGHGFFNYEYLEHYNKIAREADKFLQELGYLKTKNINKK